MKKIHFIIFAFLANPGFTFSQSWMQKTSIFNYGRYSAIGCAANGKGYAGMGQNEDGTYLDDFWEYDPESNLWNRKADFPGIGRYGASAHSMNGKIYVCFGYDNMRVCRNDIWEYNPKNDTWTEKAELPGQARYSAAGFVIGDSVLYIGTGTYGNSSDYLFDFWMYNPAKNTWTRKSDFQGLKRQDAASFSINGKGYLGSGLSGLNNPTRDFWKYDPVTDVWSAIQSLPEENATLVGFNIGAKGYLGGGTGSFPYSYTNHFLEYNPDTDTWTQAKPLNNAIPRYAGIGFSIGNVGYFGTGFNEGNFFSDFWAFDSEGNEDENDCLCETDFDLYLYPNPATYRIILEIKKGYVFKNVMVYIYNSLGQFTVFHTTQQDKTEININQLEPGLYMARIFVDSKVSVKRFIKM
jgi:hypothetical protein